MFFDSNKYVYFNCNANEGVPGIDQGGTCFSVDHEGDYALILSGEYHRLRSLSPPRASQVAIIHGKEHVWIFGRVNGHLVAFEAVLEDHLGGDTELVLGVSALRQVNAARQRVAGQDEETIDLTSEWYKRIGEHPWRLKAICSSGGLVAPVVKVGTQQTTMISTLTYHELLSANQAGALRLADQAALASSRADLLANGQKCRGHVPYLQATIVLTINRVAVALVVSVIPGPGSNIMLGQQAMQVIKHDVSPDPILGSTRSSDDVVNLQQMDAVLREHCRSENHTLATYPQRMALVQMEMQRRRKSKADTRGFLAWLRAVSTTSCARPYCPNLTVSDYCCRTCAHQHLDVVQGLIRGSSCKIPRCRGLKRGKLLQSELMEGQTPEFFDFCGRSCRNAFRTQRDEDRSSWREVN